MSSSTEAIRRRRALVSIGAIAASGLAVRLLYLVHVTSAPGFVWDDPDSYSRNAEWLARSGSFWDFRVVEHGVAGRQYVLPPLYPFFLSLFARFPGYPFTAQLAQVLLSSMSIVLVYLLGREVHSHRAGLVAAGISALALPGILSVWSTMQEALYLPLVLLAFVLLLHAMRRERPLVLFALSGAAFGLAALTRSMPLYYVPVAAALLIGLRRFRGTLSLVAGFLALTLPYSVALSLHLGAPTFLENHGGIRVAEEHGIETGDPPGAIETAATLIDAFVASPGAAVRGYLATAKSILHVNGGRLLTIYLNAETKVGSLLWKAAAHGLADLPLVLSLFLAPFGIALCRSKSSGAFLGLWILVNFGLTTLSGFGGPRLRAPFEPHLLVLAAVVVAGEYGRARSAVLAGAAGLSVLAALAVAPQLPSSFRARGDYGVHWPLDPVPKRSAMSGHAGFNVLALDGALEYWVRPRNEGSTVLAVSLHSDPVERVTVDSEHRFRHPWAELELVYVELEARDEATGDPVRALVVVPGRQVEER
jgi:4-amino-4-deoxy-L-arabinose transferase-like glycosyltransferase